MSNTPIFYHIPSDLDDESHPNVFYVQPQSGTLTLGDVRNSFPLPGQYHFRFKTNFKSTFVWKDTQKDSDKIPSHDGKFVAKISRLRTPASNTNQTSASSSSINNTTKQSSNTAAPTTAAARASRKTQQKQKQKQQQQQRKGNIEKGNNSNNNNNNDRPRQRAPSTNSNGKERRYSDLLDLGSMMGDSASSGSATPTDQSGNRSTSTSDTSDLGGLDFGAPSQTIPMRAPGQSFGGSSMDALNPMNMGGNGSNGGNGGNMNNGSRKPSISIKPNNAPSQQKRRNSPRSQALNGFLDGF